MNFDKVSLDVFAMRFNIVKCGVFKRSASVSDSASPATQMQLGLQHHSHHHHWQRKRLGTFPQHHWLSTEQVWNQNRVQGFGSSAGCKAARIAGYHLVVVTCRLPFPNNWIVTWTAGIVQGSLCEMRIRNKALYKRSPIWKQWLQEIAGVNLCRTPLPVLYIYIIPRYT